MRAFSTATDSCPASVASSAWSYSDPLPSRVTRTMPAGCPFTNNGATERARRYVRRWIEVDHDLVGSEAGAQMPGRTRHDLGLRPDHRHLTADRRQCTEAADPFALVAERVGRLRQQLYL